MLSIFLYIISNTVRFFLTMKLAAVIELINTRTKNPQQYM